MQKAPRSSILNKAVALSLACCLIIDPVVANAATPGSSSRTVSAPFAQEALSFSGSGRYLGAPTMAVAGGVILVGSLWARDIPFGTALHALSFGSLWLGIQMVFHLDTGPDGMVGPDDFADLQETIGMLATWLRVPPSTVEGHLRLFNGENRTLTRRQLRTLANRLNGITSEEIGDFQDKWRQNPTSALAYLLMWAGRLEVREPIRVAQRVINPRPEDIPIANHPAEARDIALRGLDTTLEVFSPKAVYWPVEVLTMLSLKGKLLSLQKRFPEAHATFNYLFASIPQMLPRAKNSKPVADKIRRQMAFAAGHWAEISLDQQQPENVLSLLGAKGDRPYWDFAYKDYASMQGVQTFCLALIDLGLYDDALNVLNRINKPEGIELSKLRERDERLLSRIRIMASILKRDHDQEITGSLLGHRLESAVWCVDNGFYGMARRWLHGLPDAASNGHVTVGDLRQMIEKKTAEGMPVLNDPPDDNTKSTPRWLGSAA